MDSLVNSGESFIPCRHRTWGEWLGRNGIQEGSLSLFIPQETLVNSDKLLSPYWGGVARAGRDGIQEGRLSLFLPLESSVNRGKLLSPCSHRTWEE